MVKEAVEEAVQGGGLRRWFKEAVRGGGLRRRFEEAVKEAVRVV